MLLEVTLNLDMALMVTSEFIFLEFYQPTYTRYRYAQNMQANKFQAINHNTFYGFKIYIWSQSAMESWKRP